MTARRVYEDGDRLPVADLVRFTGSRSVVTAATALGMPDSSLHRWHNQGGIPWPTADRLAVRLGVHPSAVWGRRWWTVGDDERVSA